MNIQIQDNEVIILNGVEYIRKERVKTLPSEPKFKVGDWCVTDSGKTFHVTLVHQDGCVDGVTYWNEGNLWHWLPSCVRLATKEEIESHLRKICDEKYVGKIVKCLRSGTGKITNFCFYDPKSDSMVYEKDNGIWMWLFEKGRFAELIPNKKPIPKTREEFTKFQDDWCELSNSNVTWETFLDQYDFNE